MVTRKMIVAMFMAVLVSMSTTAWGTHYYVDKNGDDSNGLSWATAFNTIQQGIDASNPTIVEVNEGTYEENVDFDGVACTVTSTDPFDWEIVANTIIIDSSGETQGVYFHNAEGADSVLAGFTVKGGYFGVRCDSADPTIENCIIKSNVVGIFDEGFSSLTIRYNKVLENTNSGIYLIDSSASIKNNWICNNMYNGVYTTNAVSVVLRNNTIAGNENYGVWNEYIGTPPSISNCILWDNNDDLYYCTATYSCIQNGDSGTGNISSNPDFTDYDDQDFHLLWDSPCINSGDESGNYNGETDIDGEDREIDDRVDMGADEVVSYIWTSPGSLNVTLHEGGTDTEILTIGNSGQGDLHFDIWPSNKEALEMYGAEMEEGQSFGYEVESSENEIVLEYDFSEPIVTNDGKYDHLIMEGLDNFEQVGAPIIPMRGVKALIPYGKRVVDIQLSILDKHKLPGKYYLLPAQEPIPISGNNGIERTKPDPAIYSSNKSWPGLYYKGPITQSKRGYQLCFVKLFPVQYKPKSGKVSYTSKLRLTIILADTTTETILRPTKKLKSYLTKKVDNPKALGTYPSKPVGRRDERIIISTEECGSGFVPGQSYEYIIITSEYLLEAAPEPWNFQRLRDSKVARDLSAAIVTTEWIYDEYDGTGEDDQALIRNFLIDVYDWYTGDDPQYALLGGSDEIIPVRKFYGYTSFDGGTEANIPCDMYYGCLDPCDCNFNYDGDEYYGEPNDGIDGNEIDFEADIYIGRAGVRNIEDVSIFVQKTLIYNATISDYLLRVSMVGEQMDEVSYAKPELEEIRLGGTYNGLFTYGFENHESTDFFDFNTAKNLYEQDDDWDVSELVDLMNNGVHVLDHVAHSFTYQIGKFFTHHLPQLTNEDYYFVYSQGCYPGEFDLGLEQCFAEQVTVKPHGAFAAIMNSRYGWYSPCRTNGPSQMFNRRFWDTVLNDDPNVRALEIGRANQVSKEEYFYDHYEETGYNRWVFFELNMFGDPEQQFIFGQARDSAWFKADPSSGTVEGEDSNEIDIDFDAGSLAPGTYEGDIIISSSDHPKPTVTVPVSMTVLQKPPAVTPYGSFEAIRLGERASFNPESMTYTLTNNGITSLNWTASSTDNWIDIDPNSGSLDPNEAVDVVISFSQNAYDLTKGSYYGNIHFTNTSTSITHKRVVFMDYSYDYLTEIFDSEELDFENQTLTFYSDGSDSFYTVCRQSASEFPTDPNGGTALTLHTGELLYESERIDINDQKQVSLYGESYNYLYVCGTGLITFETDELTRYTIMGTVGLDNHFLSPGISGLYSMLAPWDANVGDISYKQLEDRIAVTFDNVPEYESPYNSNSFQMELFFDGRIRITHLNLAFSEPSVYPVIVVGLSEGGGTPEDFIESDLSEYGSSCPGVHNIDKNIWYMSIQDAIDDASNGDEIVARPGTYYEVVDFNDKAVTVRSADPSDDNVVAATIIDANGVGRVVTFDKGEDANSVLTGFTITGGYAPGTGNARDGGGIFCYGSSPTISRCVIYDNDAGDDGGGISCDNSSSPTISYCLITSNEAGDGGGICCNNSSSPTISYCDITDNDADDKGGGIYCKANSGPAINNCDISNNQASGDGGAVHCLSSNPNILNCIISDNISDDDGGGIYCNDSEPDIVNCTLTQNEADDKGGGFYCKDGSDPVITNCILWDDTATTGPEIHVSSSGSTSNPVVSYSDVEGGWSGAYNINSDPCFVDPGNDDFHLGADSPCIDKGDPNGDYTGQTDIDGEPRVMGDCNEIVDIGADEVYFPDCWNYGTQCYGDADCDDYVGDADYSILLASWGKDYPDSQYNPCADFNKDGNVNLGDLVILNINFDTSPDPNCECGGTWPPQ